MPGHLAALRLTPRLYLRQRLIEIDQHHDAGFSGHAGQCDKADHDRHRQVEAKPPHQPDSTDQREWQRQHDDHRVRNRAEVKIQQKEDNQQRDRHHNFQARGRALEIFKLPAPHHVGARRKLDARLHRLLGVGDVSAKIAVADINIDIDGELAVLGADRCRAA